MSFNFVSYEQLVKDVTDWATKLPKFDMVVGIPRSGMLPATILALYWNVPLASLDDYLKGKTMGAGNRLKNLPITNVLVVDDSMFRGTSIQQAKELLKDKKHKISYASVYIAKKEITPDYYYKLIPQTRAFQWNIMAHKELLEISCWDIDGCLCVKPTPEQNDDGDKYREFILNTPPKYVPQHPIRCIITSRLEKFRKETEEWLKKHNIQYERLVMLNYPTGEIRRRLGHHGVHKAEVYQRIKSILFIEDEPWQAQQIALKSGKACLCVGDWKLYGGQE